jgi:hypothetical protein
MKVAKDTSLLRYGNNYNSKGFIVQAAGDKFTTLYFLRTFQMDPVS